MSWGMTFWKSEYIVLPSAIGNTCGTADPMGCSARVVSQTRPMTSTNWHLHVTLQLTTHGMSSAGSTEKASGMHALVQECFTSAWVVRWSPFG